MNKLTGINGGNTPNVTKDAVRQMATMQPEIVEYLRMMAKFHREKYLALKTEGFSHTEALELCKIILP